MKKFKHKKSLGQNFLNNIDIVGDIIDSSDLKKEDVVLEIGPGQGVLTEELAKISGQVLAVELDDRLVPTLEEKFTNVDNVEIIHSDILKINLNEMLANHDLKAASYKVVANIPYYITAPIIRMFLEAESQPSEIMLMVQKEVAERLVAEPGEMSILSVSAQYYADVKYLFTVPKEDFDPIPKVDSAIIKLKIKNQKSEYDKDFFRVVKIGFSAKRKTLANNLANGFQINKKDIEDILAGLGFSESVRAQELSVDDWRNLSEQFS